MAPTDATPSMLTDVLKGFAGYLKREEGLSPGTIRQYGADCSRLANWLSEYRAQLTSWSDVQTRDLRAYVDQQEPEPARNRRLLASWRKLWGYLSDVEGLTMHPGPTGIKRVKLPSRQPQYLTPSEVSRLLASVDGASPEQTKRNKAVIGFLYGTGCRIAEALSLTVDQVEDDFDGAPHKIRVIGKGNKERTIFLSPTAQRVLKEWLAFRQLYIADSTIVFCHLRSQKAGQAVTARSIERVVKAAGERAGLAPEKCTPHKLRHSHATALVKAGRRLEEVQEILGHESIATTRIYAHLEPERLAAAAASLPDVL
ncbi:tyrosine-type recombinase/integrase (plasmid) [Deinococcus sp. D7000]|nr:tyrosine-type recombinase/integrase [Deinococcus sp. D7000]